MTLDLKGLPMDQTITINELMGSYFAEIAKVDEQLHCLKCKQVTQFSRKTSFWKYPKYLIIRLKRF